MGIRKARPAANSAGNKCRSTSFFSARERASTDAPKRALQDAFEKHAARLFFFGTFPAPCSVAILSCEHHSMVAEEMDEFTDETCDNDGWYDFYVGINGFSENRMDSSIAFYVVNADSPDNEAQYSIDLTAEEQAAIYTCLDEQCKIYLGKGCEELLAEVGKELEEGSS